MAETGFCRQKPNPDGYQWEVVENEVNPRNPDIEHSKMAASKDELTGAMCRLTKSLLPDPMFHH